MSTTRGWSTCRGVPSRRLRSHLISGISCLCAILLVACQGSSASGPPITIGLIAPLSGPLASTGEAIQRGMLLAMDEVNRAGGVLGRSLTLATQDVQNEPAAGVVALRKLVQEHGIVAVFGGTFSPVMLA
jgi:branched-chain amino acid transport system substrate-binding protein